MVAKETNHTIAFWEYLTCRGLTELHMLLGALWICIQRPWEGMIWEVKAERMISVGHTLLVPIERCSSHAGYHNSNTPKRFKVGAHFRKDQRLFSVHGKKKAFCLSPSGGGKLVTKRFQIHDTKRAHCKFGSP